VYTFSVANSSAIDRLRSIESKIRVISGLDGVNPMLVELLDGISEDAEWLCDTLWSAWATVEAYQHELRGLYNGDI